MTLTVNVLPDSSAPAPAARAAAPTVSSTLVNDLGALARQQLPNAVPATALIAAYSGNVAPAPKQAVRMTSTASSSLAAQFIAQTPDISQQDMEIFAVQTPPMPANENENEGDDFRAALKLARGDFSEIAAKAAQTNAAKPSQAAQQTANREAVANAKLPTGGAGDSAIRTNFLGLATSLPNLNAAPMKRPALMNTRGIGAYQLAQTRNATSAKSSDFAAL